MALTFTGASSSYCSVTEFLKRCDYNTVGQVVSDNGKPVDPASLQVDLNLLAALRGASGEFEAACLMGNRYQPTDLADQVVSGTPPGMVPGSNSANYRDDIITGLVLPRLFRRRPDLLERFKWAVEQSQKALKDLRDGEMIFAFAQVQNASLEQASQETWEEAECRYLSTVEGRRFYGQQGYRRWYGRCQ